MLTGGSNYVNINWDYNNPVIGTYHLFPDKVKSDLVEMYEHGQRKITLVCWFAPLDFPGVVDHRWGHIIDCIGGALYPQHKQNLIDLLALIAATGFNELHFRFAATAKAFPSQWNGVWNRAQFLEDWSFIDSTRNLIVANTSLPVMFDLGVEHASRELADDKLRRLFVRMLWTNYVREHGTSDSCGFSVLHGKDGLIPMLNEFRWGNLPMPSCYCFDSYGETGTVLTDIAGVLKTYGEISKPVYIQETLYNDAQTCADIKAAVAQTGLNFKCIFQWPIVRDLDKHLFPDVFPKRFDNYLVEV